MVKIKKTKQKIEKPRFEKKPQFAACCACPGSEASVATGLTTAICGVINVVI